MFDNTNPYTLRTEVVAGIEKYYVSFIDGQAGRWEIEASRPVYLELLRFVKVERNLRRWDERHTEYSDLTDETLNKRALYPQKSIEDTAFDSLRTEKLWQAIHKLPKIQRRRLILHHEFGLTYRQIATMEGCTTRSIEYSVSIAKENIKKVFA